jgi:hypothetical protein
MNENIKEYIKYAVEITSQIKQLNTDDYIKQILIDKILSPYVYWEREYQQIQNKPTQKQLEYAKVLGIEVTENMTREYLSQLISQKLLETTQKQLK